jgi:hypothetical protein
MQRGEVLPSRSSPNKKTPENFSKIEKHINLVNSPAQDTYQVPGTCRKRQLKKHEIISIYSKYVLTTRITTGTKVHGAKTFVSIKIVLTFTKFPFPVPTGRRWMFLKVNGPCIKHFRGSIVGYCNRTLKMNACVFELTMAIFH